jgi:PAS domain S-box-containing protein
VEVSQYVLAALRRDEEFVLYRGEHSDQPGSPSVLLLAPASMQPALGSIKKIEHEYSLRDELVSSWAVRPLALSDQPGQMTLVLEDPGGETLDRFLPGPMELTRFLRFAVGIATALSGLHEKGLIHKDIKPPNVLLNPATGQARLMGFGIASRLLRERQAPGPPESIAGTFSYMAPEQTGRMNRSIDSRSDLYALGVTLYEMVTGTLPFMASDPMELVHCHIARQPTPPCERLKDLPPAVSAIIMKLLAKTAEDRYQTAAGAGSDLKRCLHEWEMQNRIDDFPLGEHDTPDRLLIQEKLYGRESEIDTLLAAFDRVVAGAKPELVLVSGYSGIGKTSLVNELHKWLVPSRGLFASGKFDEYKRDIPYATLAQAFQQLIQALLGKSEAELSRWRDALREALDPNGQLIVNLVPNLELIIGEQPPAPELPPQEEQRRFQLVFRRFIGVFARPEHPLALFLDDLQWLDAATLDLLEDVLTRSDLQHLMLIGAYRDNEVTPAHPLMRRIEAIRNAGASVNEVRLLPLAREHVDQLIADALHCEPGRATPLGQLVYEKTAGNPFFVIQFLLALAHEGLLAFDHRACRWSWDVARIHAKGYTANVADLMVGKLSRLPTATQEALQQLACLGNRGDIATLALGTSEEQLHADLWEAVRLELIERLDGAYRFLHDRVHEAAYSLIPEPSRADAHLRIGRLLVAHTPRDEREEIIFEIVNQLNRGVALISSPDEREELAGLNLMAGKRAKNATAYASALTYLTAGRTLLPEDCWERCAALTFAFEVHRAECEFLTGAFAAAEERLSELSSRELPLVDLATVTMLKGELFTTLGRSDRAVEACLDYLRHTGVRWSPHPTKEEVQQEYERLLRQIGNRRIEELVELPLMTSPEGRATMDVLTAALAPAAHNYDDLIFLVVCRMANLSLEDGNSDGSCFAYVWLGTLIGIRFGTYRVGFSFGKLGLDLVEHRGLRRFEARVYLLFAIISHWTQPVRTGLGLVRRAREAANRLGDIAFAGYSYPALIPCLLATGEPLADVQREAEAGLDFARRFRFGVVIDLNSVHLRLIRTLRGLTPEFGSFDDAEFDEGPFEQQLAEDPRLSLIAFVYWLRKLQARFFAGAYASAVAAAANAHRLWRKTPAVLEQADYEFYAALARAAHCDAASTAERTQHHEALAAHHRQLQEWAGNCPENFEDRAALVGAELARIEGGDAEAMRLYERAIRSARANGFLHNEALAYELAARFYSARGFEEIARLYLGNARHGYLRWGADGKVRQLDRQDPQLKQEEPVTGSTSIVAAHVEHLDLATVIKVSQVVSGEMVMEKLIDRLMRAAIEHAGAERGLLIVPQGDELHTQAVAATSGEDVSVELPDGTHTGAALPESLVRYVMRTRETVLLDDAASQNPFSGDPYIVRRRARSILCLPLINQTKIIGILYLENNLMPHVFATGRVTVLKVLASHAAISLENARLYCDVENREAQLRLITDTTPAMICSCLPDGSTDFFNRRWLEYLNLPLEEIRGWRWTSVIHPEDLEDLVNKWRSSLATGEPLEVEARSRRGDGEYRRLLHRTVPLRNEHGKVVRWYISSIDVEDRRRAEEAVRRSEAYLAEAQKLSHTGSFGWNVSTDVHFWSDETFRIFEFDPSATVSLPTILERVHPQDMRSMDMAIDAAHRAEGINLEFRLLMPDGRIKYLHVVGKANRGETGAIEVIGAVMDVTARKLTEIELRRSKAHLADAQRLSRTGSVGMEVSTKRIFWSDEAARIYGYPPGTEPTPDLILRRSHPDDVGLLADVLGRAAQGGHKFDWEHRLLMPDGSLKHIRDLAHSVRDEAGNEEIVGAILDITERKVAEEAIREQETELRQILDFALQSVVVVGPGGERLYANRAALDHYGLSLEEWRQTPGGFFDPGARLHPEDRERAMRCHSDSIRSGGTAYELELRVRRRDGSYRWFLARYNAVRDDKGQIKRWYVSATNIEDRKRAEEKIQRENVALREEIDKASMFEEIIGTSRSLKAVLSRIAKVAPTDSTVLITGETGTGKELIARAVHKRSRRSGHAFVSVNCAALAPTLISSELFGHEKGAFTGAMQRRPGRFELADGGTIFLDEVAELLPDTQAALLRVLQEREFERVGGGQPIRVDVRLIAATNRDLTAAVANGIFRQDLFYRLNVFPIEVPSLRERKEDILILVEYFMQRYASRVGKNIRSIDKKTLDLLQSYDWPGNIRELQNVIERSIILSSGDVFSVDELWLSKRTPSQTPPIETSLASRDEPRSEREIIEAALAESRGRVSGPSGAAAKLRIPSTTLATRIKALKINKLQFKFPAG